MAAKSVGTHGKQTDFTIGPIVKPVVLFAIPAMLGNFLNALYNVVDTIVVGRFVGANALAAVGCCFSITMVCMAVNSFGTTLTMFAGQNMGAGEEKRRNDGIKKISGLIIGLCVLITVICLLGARYVSSVRER